MQFWGKQLEGLLFIRPSLKSFHPSLGKSASVEKNPVLFISNRELQLRQSCVKCYSLCMPTSSKDKNSKVTFIHKVVEISLAKP